MAKEAVENGGHATPRLADSAEDAMRSLVALPLRMMAGTLGIFEALLRTAADAITERKPTDERVVDLERRMESFEKRAGATSAARKSTATSADTAAEQRGA